MQNIYCLNCEKKIGVSTYGYPNLRSIFCSEECWKKYVEDAQDRNNDIIEMREKGHTLQQIAKKHNITKQRVSQILKNYSDELFSENEPATQ